MLTFLNASCLYALIGSEFNSIAPIIQDFMDASTTANRFYDKSLFIKKLDLVRRDVCKALTTFLSEYVA